MAKRQPHMSAAPSYIVYGHRHAVRLVTRLIAIGLLLAAIVTVLAVLRSGGDSGKPAAEAPATPHGGGATTVAAAKHTGTGTGKAAGAVKNKPPAKHPATKPKSHKPARPIPCPARRP